MLSQPITLDAVAAPSAAEILGARIAAGIT
jgi:hypothetical protein